MSRARRIIGFMRFGYSRGMNPKRAEQPWDSGSWIRERRSSMKREADASTETSVLANPRSSSLIQAGALANAYAARSAFTDYQSRLDPSTLARQQDDLAHYGLYLKDAGVSVSALDLFMCPESWAGTTHGIIRGFVQWMLLDGYSIGTVNIRLSTVRTYARLAAAAGAIPPTELALLAQVKGYSHAHGQNVDAQREHSRKGAKKAQPVP